MAIEETALLSCSSCCCRCLKSLTSLDEVAGDNDQKSPAVVAAQEGNRLNEEAMLQAIREAVAEAMSTVVLPAIKQQQQKQSSSEAKRTDSHVKVDDGEKPVLPKCPPFPRPQFLEADPSCPDCVQYLRKKSHRQKLQQPTHPSPPLNWRTRIAHEEGSATSLPRDPRLNRNAELLLQHSADLQAAARNLNAAYIRPHLTEGPLAEATNELMTEGERLLVEVVNPPLERAIEKAADGLAVLASFTSGYVRWLANDVVLSLGDAAVASAAALGRAARTVVHHGGLIVDDLIVGGVPNASTLSSNLARETKLGSTLEPQSPPAKKAEVKTPKATAEPRTTPLQWLWKAVLAPPNEEQWQLGSLAHWPASSGLTEWPLSGPPPPSS